jgi:hypothetical protein
VFPAVATGFNDTNAYLRELTLKSMLLLAPKLSQRTINQVLLKHLAKLQVTPWFYCMTLKAAVMIEVCEQPKCHYLRSPLSLVDNCVREVTGSQGCSLLAMTSGSSDDAAQARRRGSHGAVRAQVDEEPPIRANTTILLGNLAEHLSEATQKRVLLNAFTRALKDLFPPARVAGLRVSTRIRQYLGCNALVAGCCPLS